MEKIRKRHHLVAGRRNDMALFADAEVRQAEATEQIDGEQQ
jgi:hypothetical protein